MMVWDHEDVAQRAEALEREGAKEMRRLAEARAVAGPEHVDGTDGSEIIVADDGAAVATDGGEDEEEDNAHASALNQTLNESDNSDLERPLLNVGDHVTDAVDDDRDATMVVVGLPSVKAAAYELDGDGKATVADVNPERFAEDRVIECAFCNPTDTDLDETKRYAFPRGRVELETPIHDRDDGDEGSDA
jgi:hypothetical protein